MPEYGKPFTPAESQDATHEFMADMHYKGVWNRVCNLCGEIVGQSLHPLTEDDIKYDVCPWCHPKRSLRIEYQAGEGEVA